MPRLVLLWLYAELRTRGTPSGNKHFVEDVAGWTFQETNALRIDRVEHHRVNETEPREQYTINDNVVRITISW